VQVWYPLITKPTPHHQHSPHEALTRLTCSHAMREEPLGAEGCRAGKGSRAGTLGKVPASVLC
jgi:hypothetical protein